MSRNKIILLKEGGGGKTLPLRGREQVLKLLGGRIDHSIHASGYVVLYNSLSRGKMNLKAHEMTGYTFKVLRGDVILCSLNEFQIIK